MTDLNDDFFRHISSEFNEELENLRRSLLEMGGLVEDQLNSALACCPTASIFIESWRVQY